MLGTTWEVRMSTAGLCVQNDRSHVFSREAIRRIKEGEASSM